MGLLRLFLAMCVVDAHAHLLPVRLLPADVAVQIFYMISGFYMAMVLSEKYLPGQRGYRVFLESRLFRLFPMYLVVLTVTLVAWWFGYIHIAPADTLIDADRGPENGVAFSAWWVLAQLLLVGLDWAHFFTFDSAGGIAFTGDFHREIVQFWRFLFVPQAWSLAVELYFYALAPFIVRRSLGFVVLVIVLSTALRIAVGCVTGLRFDPWSYRFFPFELVYFLAGALAYRLAGAARAGDGGTQACMRFAIIGAVCVFVSSYIGRIGLGGQNFFLSPFVMVAVFLGLPTWFSLWRSNRLDRYIGELSYPVYVCHMALYWWFDQHFPLTDLMTKFTFVGCLCLVAVALHQFVNRPMERVRVVRSG
jgi:peptidoglycan/LPS O-acetylase OafA/YrhL